MNSEQSDTPTTTEELLSLLVGPCPNSYGGWTTRCPCDAAHVLLVRPPSQPGRLWCANGCSAERIRTALGFDPEAVKIDPPDAQSSESADVEISTPTSVPEFLTPNANSNGTASRAIVVESNEPESRHGQAAAAVVKPRRADLEAEIRRLHGEGLSDREIARRVQMHHTSVGRILKSNGVAG